MDNAAGLEKILAIESEYQKKGLILEDLYSATILFALLVLAFPLFIYYLYGREPEIDYKAISKKRYLPIPNLPL